MTTSDSDGTRGDLESSRSPAEALRQRIGELIELSTRTQWKLDHPQAFTEMIEDLYSLFTAYAATIEREARKDELQTYFDTFNDNNFTPMRTINYCERRLAALQGTEE